MVQAIPFLCPGWPLPAPEEADELEGFQSVEPAVKGLRPGGGIVRRIL